MTQLKFNRRPTPVFPEHRPLYKIAQVLLILKDSRGRKSSLPRLHLFNWALKSEQRMQMLLDSIKQDRLSLPTWGFDPALAIALRFAVAEHLIAQVANGYQLEEKGRRFIEDAMKDRGILQAERAVMTEVGKGITEKMVEAVAKDWE